MKEAKEKKKNYIIWLILLVGICLIIACGLITRYLTEKNRRYSDENMLAGNYKMNIMDNFKTTDISTGNHYTLETTSDGDGKQYDLHCFYGGRFT